MDHKQLLLGGIPTILCYCWLYVDYTLYIYIITAWWFQPTPVKNHGLKVSWDDEIPNHLGMVGDGSQLGGDPNCSPSPTITKIPRNHHKPTKRLIFFLNLQ